MFTSKDNKSLYSINFQETSQEYIAQIASILYEHVFESEVKYLKYQRLPDPVLWIVLKNGNCYSVAYDRTANLNGLSKFDPGGFVDCIDIQKSGNTEIVAFIIKRGDDHYLEFLNYGTSGPSTYLDSYLEVDMTGITDGVVTGLDHLEGEEVYVVADDLVFGLYTVASGEVIILDDNNDPYVPTVKTVYAGLPYTATVAPNTLEAKEGAGVNEQQKITYVTPYVYQTNNLEIADQSENFIEVRFRDMDDNMNEQVPERTAYKRVSIKGQSSRNANIVARSTLPLPCNILSFVTEVEV